MNQPQKSQMWVYYFAWLCVVPAMAILFFVRYNMLMHFLSPNMLDLPFHFAIGLLFVAIGLFALHQYLNHKK